MQQPIRALKQRAKDSMKQATPYPSFVSAVYLLISGIISYLLVSSLMAILASLQVFFESAFAGFSTPGPGPTFFIVALLALACIPLLSLSCLTEFGLQSYCLRLARFEKVGYRDLLNGFPTFLKVILLNLSVFIRIQLWSLIAWFPAAILNEIASRSLSPDAAKVVSGILAFLSILFMLFITLRYVFSNYILIDHPELSIRDIIQKSRSLMQGNKLLYVRLMLSFLGWSIGLSAIFAIGAAAVSLSGFGFFAIIPSVIVGFPLLAWLLPYIQATEANLYDEILSRGKESES